MAESIPLSRRTKQDLVIRDGEQYRRGEIDRPITEPDAVFSILHHAFGESRLVDNVMMGTFPENTPSHIAAERLEATGRVAIADIGCGTGNTLLTWGRKVADTVGRGLGAITMTGLSRSDFRGESLQEATNKAVRGTMPRINYLVGDAQNMPEVPTDSQDVVLAYNSLFYATHPDAWLEEMVRITKPGGTVLFTSTFEQSGIISPFDRESHANPPEQSELDLPLNKGLLALRGAGYPILCSAMLRDRAQMTIVTETQPGIKDYSLYRVDIPPTEAVSMPVS